MADEWDDMSCLDQSFYILLTVESTSGEEVETGATYPSLADQRAGSQRLVVVVKVVNDGVNQLLRKSPGTVFLSTTTRSMRLRYIRGRNEIVSAVNVHLSDPSKKGNSWIAIV